MRISEGDIILDRVGQGAAVGMSVRFRGANGARITVTIEQAQVPASREEAIELAREAIEQLAAARTPFRLAEPEVTEKPRIRPRNDDAMFRSWAFPEL